MIFEGKNSNFDVNYVHSVSTNHVFTLKISNCRALSQIIRFQDIYYRLDVLLSDLLPSVGDGLHLREKLEKFSFLSFVFCFLLNPTPCYTI